MGRAPCCDKVGLKKGPWTPEEDDLLINYINEHGHGSWRALPKKAGLLRCGKSCRLRWTNYLRPDIKRGEFSCREEESIIYLHALLGNRWSAIASHLPQRTDNEIKNYWNTHLKKRLSKLGIDPVTHKMKIAILGTSANGVPQGGDGIAALSHMAQWESARLEAEARLAREAKLRAEGLWSGSYSSLVLPQAREQERSPRINLEEMANLMDNWEKSLQGNKPDCQSAAVEGLDTIGSCTATMPSSSLKLNQGSPTVCCTGTNFHSPAEPGHSSDIDHPNMMSLNCSDSSTSRASLMCEIVWPSASDGCKAGEECVIGEDASSKMPQHWASDNVSDVDAKSGSTMALSGLQDLDLDALTNEISSIFYDCQLSSMEKEGESHYLVRPQAEVSDHGENHNTTMPDILNAESPSRLAADRTLSFSILLADDFSDDWSSMLKENLDDSMEDC